MLNNANVQIRQILTDEVLFLIYIIHYCLKTTLMWYELSWMCLVIYMAFACWLLLGVAFQLHLLHKSRMPVQDKITDDSDFFPSITIQVPVYNEKHVINSLMTALASIDYPSELLQIQILDDSDDETSLLIDKQIEILSLKNIDVKVLRRVERKGYKAGALQAALPYATGEFVAVFDADFQPAPNTIVRMIKYFEDARVGIVQARWAHSNLMENSLTLIQSFLLDSHFGLEQLGRAKAGYLMNFNGTAGIWRKVCIEDCGGWNGKVLTEDLELSYRAQLRGWKLCYDDNIRVPAELPGMISAFKTQQFRWAKGIIQTSRLHISQVMRQSLPAATKWHALFHLTAPLTFVAVIATALLTVPLLAGRAFFPDFREATYLLAATGITLPLLCIFFYFGTRRSISRRLFWTHLPLFLVVYMGLSVQNCIAVIEGLSGRQSPFVRTPKAGNKKADNVYLKQNWTTINWIELFVMLYIISGIILSIYWKDYFFLLFLIMMLSGLLFLLMPERIKHNPRKQHFIEQRLT